MARIIGRVFPVPSGSGKTLKTKAEIKAFLDEKGIEYSSDATVAELKALIPQE